MTKLDPNLPVGQIAVEYRESIPLFERYGIDYYTQGSRSLRDACYLANVPLPDVLVSLEKLEPLRKEWYLEERDWRDEPMSALVEHIQEVHHVYARTQMDRIETMLEHMASIDSERSPLLYEIHKLFIKMAEEFRDHLLEEEEVFFPYLLQVEHSLKKMEPLPRTFEGYNLQTHPLRILLSDHGMMGAEWRQIEELTHHFEPPQGASRRLKELYAALRDFQKDNQKHIHLENNILFYRAIRMGLLDKGGASNQPSEKITHI
jgi:regulator of cell morphogenesis and NO signaling